MKSIGTRGRAGVAALALALFAAGIAGSAHATHGRALDATWSGTWDTSRSFSWTFTQSGSSVVGTAAAVSYKFVGTVSGATLTGKEYGDNTLIAQCEYVKVTLAPDGKSWSGYFGASVTGPPKSVPVCPPTASGFTYTGTCSGGACLANTGAVSAPAIVGTWEFADGAVKVTAAGSSRFSGVLVKRTAETCKRPLGQKVWTITGSGTKYAGTHVAYAARCKAAAVPATFTVATKAGKPRLTLCARGVCTVHAKLKG